MSTYLKNTLLITLLVCFSIPAQAQTSPPVILDMKKRADIQNSWLTHRLDTVVPNLMDRENIDMWVIIAREYNEDPVVKTMLPATWQSARRRTILVFSRNDDTVERLAVARYDIGEFFKTAWNKEEQPQKLSLMNLKRLCPKSTKIE